MCNKAVYPGSFDPFTNGHLYLVEYAARHCDNLYVFVLSEDKSVFPADVRFSLVEKMFCLSS